MPKKADKYHGERQSPFFRLRSRANLASLLYVGPAKLSALASEPDPYFQFTKPKPSGGIREISAPRDDLKAVQARIADLLRRIAPPDYLFAPVARRSYVDNAAAHLGAHSIRLLDIEDFFPSCTANLVLPQADAMFAGRGGDHQGTCHAEELTAPGQPMQPDPRVSLLH